MSFVDKTKQCTNIQFGVELGKSLMETKRLLETHRVEAVFSEH